jgi:protein tyrosine phosphatase (PTP) superfamily phosphohydrolase (DUF442 family)
MPSKFASTLVMLTLAALVFGAAVRNERARANRSARPFVPLDEPTLPNAHRVTDKVLSGAQPEGEEAFRVLQSLGVKTIISVDGAKPDVELAHKHGMRYVHMPIGYDGVEPGEGQAIAKAILELAGPVYVHCHHGKHRSAAAVAVACVYNGMLDPARAEDVLKTFDTGTNYTGLWKAARDAKPLAPGVLQALKVEYVETAKISDLADAMVRIDQHWDHLQQIRKAGWKTPGDHPDLSPPHEALQVEEHFHEIGRTDQAKRRDEGFQRLLREAETGAKSLREVLAMETVRRDTADAAFERVTQSCTACHRDYRD